MIEFIVSSSFCSHTSYYEASSPHKAWLVVSAAHYNGFLEDKFPFGESSFTGPPTLRPVCHLLVCASDDGGVVGVLRARACFCQRRFPAFRVLQSMQYRQYECVHFERCKFPAADGRSRRCSLCSREPGQTVPAGFRGAASICCTGGGRVGWFCTCNGSVQGATVNFSLVLCTNQSAGNQLSRFRSKTDSRKRNLLKDYLPRELQVRSITILSNNPSRESSE